MFNFVTKQQIPLVIVREKLPLIIEDEQSFHLDCRLCSSLSNSPLDRQILENLLIDQPRNITMSDDQILNLAEV